MKTKLKGDSTFYAPGKKKPIAYTTNATENFMIWLHETYPDATIGQLKELLNDRTKFTILPEENKILDAYIKAGFADHIPNWRVCEVPADSPIGYAWRKKELEFAEKCMDIAWGRDATTTHKELRNIFKGRKTDE